MALEMNFLASYLCVLSLDCYDLCDSLNAEKEDSTKPNERTDCSRVCSNPKSKYGKIFKTRLMGSPTIVVNGADANRFFLSNEFKLVISSWPSSSVQLMGKDSIMEKQGEAHRCLRRVIASSLSCAVLEAMVPKICHSVESHLK
ncbi:cytochrome P450, family 718 [Actinidia rufa]|uniref:Cytochrome P450, family 718 n=1 Tax=Actinidia rufa TaxID=165716 RepID=A0A7J0DYG2_9ERIC|nr:cytochrome P450, family 718 [Actinidia rufa]